MSENTTTEVTAAPVAVKAAAKKVAKKTSPKKAVKKVTKKATKKTTAAKPADGGANFRPSKWTDAKVKVLNTVRKIGPATKEKIIEKSGVENAAHYLYLGRPEVEDLVRVVMHDVDGSNVRMYELTAKGRKMDFAAQLKK